MPPRLKIKRAPVGPKGVSQRVSLQAGAKKKMPKTNYFAPSHRSLSLPLSLFLAPTLYYFLSGGEFGRKAEADIVNVTGRITAKRKRRRSERFCGSVGCYESEK